MNTNKEMIEQLAGSEFFKEYEKAYSTTTGMPLALQPREALSHSFNDKSSGNPFCSMMARCNSACAACLQMQEKVRKDSVEKATIITCAYGLSEGAVPVRLGNQTIGFLQTGQVHAEKPSASKVARVVAQARAAGIKESPETIRKAYLETPVVPREKLKSVLRILTTFAELLSIKSNQLTVTQANSEPIAITRAKTIIRERHTEEISLQQVAKEVHVSSFYLCKLFRKATGMTFTEFVCRTRMEKAKDLLLNPNLRVSEIVYEVGFQSLTHFNRVFKKTMGQTPTSYRAQIPGHRNAPTLGAYLRMKRSNSLPIPQYA